jgi:hypothetical protein
LVTGQVIPGFDNAVTGMNVGETKTVTIPAAQAYGATPSDSNPLAGQDLTYRNYAADDKPCTIDGKTTVFRLKNNSVRP